MPSVLEHGYVSLNKFGEQLCGDKVECAYRDNHTTLVLADGLGSGVKANILSTLTSKILCTMISNGIPLTECIHTIISTLPVCAVRGVAYSTFSIVFLNDEGKGKLIEFDNPQAILLRRGKNLEPAREQLEILGKKIYVTALDMADDDYIFVYSDGVPHAGIGLSLNLGWLRPHIVDFLETTYSSDLSARAMAALIGEATKQLYQDKPGDDTTIAAIKKRSALAVNVMIGPPSSKNEDEAVAAGFMSMDGLKIVSGGTTSHIISRFLGKPIDTSIDYIDPHVPPTAAIEGIDLVTEGVITFRRVLELSREYLSPSHVEPKYFKGRDGASKIANLLFERASRVNFFIGRGNNIAHQDLPIDLTMKLKLVETLASNLKSMGKAVTLKYH